MMSIKLMNIFLICYVISLSFKLASFRVLISIPPISCLSEDNFGDAQIILMPSAWINNQLKREINVYWHNIEFQHGDTLAMFMGKPNNDTKSLWEFQPTVSSGFTRTGQYISLLHKYALTSYKEEILVFCGAWLRNGEIKKVNCLSTHPTWMHDRKVIFKDQKLTDLIIPGTYMSGLYIKTLPPQETTFETFTVSQNQDILTQLVHGARYLDIPIGHFPHLNQSYWVIYDKNKVMSLEKIIWDILFFLNGTKEIVMLAFRNFSVGFKNNSDHKNFVNYLKKKLSNHLLIQQNPNDQWSITLEEIWALDKRLIIVYESYYQVTDDYLWSSPWITNLNNFHDVNQFQDDVFASEKLIQNLFEFREKLMRELLRITYLTISVEVDIKQIEATCNKTCIDNHPSNSRRLADTLAPIITELYNEKLYQYTNIVAAKFLDATGLVDIAILWNERRVNKCVEFLTIRNQKFRGKFTRKRLYF